MYLLESLSHEILPRKYFEVYIDGLDWERLSTRHHVVSKLAEMPFMRLSRPKWLKTRGGRYVVHQVDLVNLISFNLDMI